MMGDAGACLPYASSRKPVQWMNLQVFTRVVSVQHVKDTWRCKVGTSFLDMSLLIYHFDGHRIDTVDYSHDRSIGTHRIGAVTHSGDIHLPNDEFGTGGCKMAQTGDIDFDGLVSLSRPPMPPSRVTLLRQSTIASKHAIWSGSSVCTVRGEEGKFFLAGLLFILNGHPVLTDK